MTARREDWDERIRAIIDPIESRMYAIQIHHAEWLRENHQHLVMTGPGHDTYKAIEELVLQARRSGYLEALGDFHNEACAGYGGSFLWLDDIYEKLKSRATQGEENTNSQPERKE